MSNRVELSAILGCGVRITEEGMPNVWVESKMQNIF